MRVVLLGPPGAGKGTQGRHLAERFRVPVIATGDIFRRNVADQTELGTRAKAYLDAGELVPDDVTTQMVMEAIDESPEGFVLDGFPRTIPQAEALERELDRRGIPLSAALALDLDEDTAVARIAGRRTCAKCQRSYHLVYDPPRVPGVCEVCGGSLVQRTDEDEETVRRRLEVYRESTAPLLDFYAARGLLRGIDASASEAEVTDRAVEALRELAPSSRPDP